MASNQGRQRCYRYSPITFLTSLIAYSTPTIELWTCRAFAPRGKPDAHVCTSDRLIIKFARLTGPRWPQAFYNPGRNGGIEVNLLQHQRASRASERYLFKCTGRAPDVFAPNTRYPFEVNPCHQTPLPRINSWMVV